MDVLTKKQRSFNMSRIKNSNTQLEILFRKYLWKKGLKGYKIKNRITGKPDLYFSKQKVAIFIDGCFWHRCPKDYRSPKTNIRFWSKKITNNINRDEKVNRLLKKNGIQVMRLWEHEIENDIDSCYAKINNVVNN
jgi:DNA mismatch endonuclease, patch repair protein